MKMRRIRDVDITTATTTEEEKKTPWTSCVVLLPSTWATCMFCKLATGTKSLIDCRSFYTTEEQIHELFSK
jgi:hypothetical protein